MAVFTITGVAAALGLMSAAGFLIPPLGRFSTQQQNKIWSNEQLDPYILADMWAKRFMDDETYYKEMKKHGLDEKNALRIGESTKAYLQAYDYVTLYRRGEITEDALYVFLRAQKYNDDTIENILKVTEYFPSVQDLIHFAIREVYTPDTRKRFGMDEDYPSEFEENAAKAGLPKEQAQNYWASHWQLPSAQMGFEMLQRRVISEEDLSLLLKSLDIMPFWRESLKKISYNPLTRVDVRRMYGLGVLSEEDVYNSYLDVGYNPENARLMTEFTIKYENDELDGVTRANIISAFKRDLLTSAELQEYLQDLGYSEKATNFWIEMASYEEWMEDLDELTVSLERGFKTGRSTKEEIEEFLYSNEFPTSFVDKVLNKLDAIDKSGRKVLSRADLEKALKEKVITQQMFANRISRLGYDDDDFRIIMGLNGVKESNY